jgi:AraC family transcriptional regulator
MQVRDLERPLCFDPEGNLPPLQCSGSTAWSGLPFEVHRLRSATDIGESGPKPGELGLMIITEGFYDATLRSPRGDVRLHSRPGKIVLLSGDDRPHVLEIAGSAEIVAVKLPREWLDYVGVDPTTLRFGNCDGGRSVQALVSAMRDEVARGCSAGRVYAESLSLALLSYTFHLLPGAEQGPHAAALSAKDQKRLASYIHDHLDEDLGLTTLAELVGMKPRQFSARFRNAFGATPHQYVTRARLQEGARLLATGRHAIAEIALRIGFSSQSHFTTVFRRTFGETPKRYTNARHVV